MPKVVLQVLDHSIFLLFLLVNILDLFPVLCICILVRVSFYLKFFLLELLSLDDNLFDSIELIIIFDFKILVIEPLLDSLDHLHCQAS